MNFYAQLNEEKMVVGVSELSGDVILENMISISSYDLSLLGKIWDGKKFIDNPNPPPEPTTNK